MTPSSRAALLKLRSRVQAVDSAVTKFKVGDIGGVGCMVDSCGTCDNCLADREQNRMKAATFTYNSLDRATGENTLGGYSEKMVVSERFVIRIPPGADLAAARKAEATVFTTSPGMIADARRLGAQEAALWSDTAAMTRLANRFDLLISTVPVRGAGHQGNVELIRPEQINQAFERVVSKDVRYRFVIDLTGSRDQRT